MLIGVVGYIGSGKGTVAKHLVESYKFKQDSFASSLKDVCATMFNWDRNMLEGNTDASRNYRDKVDKWWSKELGIDNFTPRLALQIIGTDVVRNYFHQDTWMLTLKNRIIKNPDFKVVISDVRFPNEIDLIKELGGTIIRVNRGEPPVWEEVAERAMKGDDVAWNEMNTRYSEVHYSEWAWLGHEFDHVIENDSTINSLEYKIFKTFDII